VLRHSYRCIVNPSSSAHGEQTFFYRLDAWGGQTERVDCGHANSKSERPDRQMIARIDMTRVAQICHMLESCRVLLTQRPINR